MVEIDMTKYASTVINYFAYYLFGGTKVIIDGEDPSKFNFA